MIKFFNSMIFKGVVAHLLLFVIIFMSSFDYNFAHLSTFIGYYLFSLVFVLVFLNQQHRMIVNVSKQMNDIKNGYLNRDKLPKGTSEINELYDEILKLGEDIVRTQNNLENQRNQLDSILAYMVDGVIATDRRGNIIMANKSALHYLNTDNEHLMEKNIVQVLKIEDQYNFYDLLEKEPEITIESHDAGNEAISLHIKFALFRRESGFISGIIAVLHDMTEQDKAERERRLFVSNVSHELRTPLTSVKAYLEALEDGAIEDKETASNFINVSLTETNRMIRMISDLLTLSRMDQDRIVLNKEMINLIAFLDYQINRLDQILETESNDLISSNFTLVRKYSEQPIWVKIDTDKIAQVIDNIIGNAIKYSPKGGTITISVEKRESDVLISISDQGMGIPKSDLLKIFDRFYRVDNASRNSKVGGTGLGLSIVHDIVKIHGGTIFARSEGEGKGTTFSFTLPYSLEAADDWDDDTDEFDFEDNE
ncbi:cell wall metabolism sensor histidine kinase WalK [Lactococcus lactis]|uniref:sensor histidine kinase n=1 Tax=Lactococcus lactis TaxID=1358 RepID=UPI00223BA8B4|nr:cell wall metabolism sensor histidine kinase WalK [Lactococcus lactis]MCT1227149.1 cell wall metabolism sensor histidine kinase WalK [Lactococcus lactis]